VKANLELVVDELVSNAVRHATPPFELHLFHLDGVIRGQVGDSNALPQINTDPDQWGSYGLRIITNTTTRWGTIPLQTGKQVWFELHMS